MDAAGTQPGSLYFLCTPLLVWFLMAGAYDVTESPVILTQGQKDPGSKSLAL